MLSSYDNSVLTLIDMIEADIVFPTKLVGNGGKIDNGPVLLLIYAAIAYRSAPPLLLYTLQSPQ